MIAITGLLLAAGGVHAQQQYPQSYPTKPIRLIVPFAPGGGSEYLARVMAQKLTESFGVPVIVDMEAVDGSSERFREVLKRDLAMLQKVVKSANIKPGG